MGENIPTSKRNHPEIDDLYELSKALTGVFRVDEVLNAILNTSLQLCKAERGAILLFDRRSPEVVKTILRSRDENKEGIDHHLNLLVAGWVYRKKKTYITDDVLRDQGYTNPSKSTRDLGASIALPLQTAGNIIGLIHLVNTRGGNRFSKETIHLGNIVASLAAQFVDRAKLHELLFARNIRLKNTLKDQWKVEHLLGDSRIIRDIKEKIPVIASSTSNVLVSGETGTGKELFSRVIHYSGPRGDQPFVAVNCAAIPASLFESELFGHEKGAFTGAIQAQRGKFELADGGTLFLDEISEMPIELQPKLLRAIEDHRYFRLGSAKEISVDIRIIAASSKDLMEEVRSERFLRALYHRLNVLPITIPPLRDRSEDIPLLVNTFIEEYSSGKSTIDDEALHFLGTRRWIGNVRELRNTVERASIFINKSRIGKKDLAGILVGEEYENSPEMDPGLSSGSRLESGVGNILEKNEKRLIEMAIEQSDGNVAEAARLLGIDRLALRRRMEKYHL